MTTYATPPGGLPAQSAERDERAVFTTAYAFIPADTMRDITISYLPGWQLMRMWIIARPLSGFAETFSHYIVEIDHLGGSSAPETDPEAEAVLFVVAGHGELTLGGQTHLLQPGSYAFLAAGDDWSIRNDHRQPFTFHWIRKRYERSDAVNAPTSFVTHESEAPVIEMPDTNGTWSTTRFVSPGDMAHDMHVNIVNFRPGGVIPFMETHVMEHGLYVLEGTARYRLNQDWFDVGPGDYMWLRAFCPQACEATGAGAFRYLLYKDVNRHAALFP